MLLNERSKTVPEDSNSFLLGEGSGLVQYCEILFMHYRKMVRSRYFEAIKNREEDLTSRCHHRAVDSPLFFRKTVENERYRWPP